MGEEDECMKRISKRAERISKIRRGYLNVRSRYPNLRRGYLKV